MIKRALGGMLAAAALSGPAAAEVTAKSPAGFALRHTAEIAAPPDRVWAALAQLPRWWNPAHSYSGRADALSFKAESGDCFCERLPDGGSVLHATVVQVLPQQTLRLHGGLGPLQGEGVQGVWTFVLKPSGSGSTLTQTYVVGGWSPNGLENMAAPVDSVMGEAFGRLKRYAETGAPG